MKSREDVREKPPRSERPEGVVIRSAAPGDAEALAALANMPGYRYGTLRLPFQSIEETRKGLETIAPGARRLVAEFDGRIVGDIFLGPMLGRRRHAASVGMGVHDDFTGRGIGSALMAAILDIADNWLNLRRVELTVFTDNANAIRLYERSGFVKEGHFRKFAFRDGAYVDAYSMARLRA
ncbi:GNAT family N-acetyltransferase [Rhizobium puerariae]|uniref:GNAT family N-acetyltransferase n=1 Tax=Rhizobium puerariae TaxID=1585791 RepID=A0ABV6AMG0_9HYPH